MSVVRFCTAIDIHPAATISGGGIFIDHGAGLVVGATAVVGAGATLYHGVTLGNSGKKVGRPFRNLASLHIQVLMFSQSACKCYFKICAQSGTALLILLLGAQFPVSLHMLQYKRSIAIDCCINIKMHIYCLFVFSFGYPRYLPNSDHGSE